ncbi:hypothetical protein C7421_103207 [Pantoea ananatis]|nr:hypothetical protein C7421_103207 [Pantoea ananatis]
MVKRYLTAADFFHRNVVLNGPGTQAVIAVDADQIQVTGATSSSGEAWESDIGEFLMAAQQNGHKVQN